MRKSLFGSMCALLAMVGMAWGDGVASPASQTTTLVPRMQIIVQGAQQGTNATFSTPPAGTVLSATRMSDSVGTFYQYILYTTEDGNTAMRYDICLRFNDAKEVSAIGYLRTGNTMGTYDADACSCILATDEPFAGVYHVTDRTTLVRPGITEIAWKFLIFWEEE